MRHVAAIAALAAVSAGVPLRAQYFRGVNISGAEFGMNNLPGRYNTDYTFNSEPTFRYFAARNLNLIRFPLQWERLQPVLQGPLDPAYLGLLKSAVSWARNAGDLFIIDIHNFARYSMNENGRLNTYVIDQLYNGSVKVSRADLADLWVRLSNEFANEAAVYAYDLMNEPHDMAGWKDISQAVLTAIRNNGDQKLIFVPGDSYSSANRWVTVNGPSGWITDPADNFMYEGHQYFDFDESGTYTRSYDAELRANPALPTIGSTRVSHFLTWCRNNNARCYLGEYGAPDSDPRWMAVLDDFLKALDDAQVSGSYWAAGEWWGNYALSVQPVSNYTVDRPQLSYLVGHLPPAIFTSVSTASGAGATFAPDSLMSGYGVGLGTDTATAPSVPWPLSLRDVTVEVTDSSGRATQAPLAFVSAGQINYVIPSGTALGRVNVAVKSAGTAVASGTYYVDRVAPTIFSGGDAKGPAIAGIVRVKPDGSQTYDYTVSFDAAQQKFVAQPIDFGGPSDMLFLILYGTGFRNATAPSAATLRVGSTTLNLAYVGAQPETPGLDQINAELPRSLAGAGLATITFQIDGKTANPATLMFR
jgi:endoglucanase